MADAVPEIGCVVLNWNGGKRILECIRSLISTRDVRTSIVVIDNGSTDDSIAQIRKSYPAVHIQECGANVGLARARNMGVKYLLEQNHRAILFIDDDATVSEDCLHRLSVAMQFEPKSGITSPRILDGLNPDTIWYDGGKVNIVGDTVHRNDRKDVRFVKANELSSMEFATGCCMLIKAEVFKYIGLLDESFCVYSEDADFSFRAQSAGYSILHVPAAVATHLQSGDTKSNRGKWFRDYYVTRNKFLLFSKHYSGMPFVVASGYHFVNSFLRIVYFAIVGEWRRSRAIVDGVTDFAKGRFGMKYS